MELLTRFELVTSSLPRRAKPVCLLDFGGDINLFVTDFAFLDKKTAKKTDVLIQCHSVQLKYG